MSRYKPKKRKPARLTDGDDDRPEDKGTKRHVFIEPGVQIDLVESLKNQHGAERNEDTTNQKTQLRWTKGATVLLVLTAGFTGWQGWMNRQLVKTAQDTYNAVDRPYVGVAGVGVVLLRPSPGGGFTKIDKLEDRQLATRMSIAIEVKNFGSVPAFNVANSIKAGMDGMPVSIDPNTSTKQGSELFPTQTLSLGVSVGEASYPKLASEESVLQVDVPISYRYGSQTYTYCEREQYESKTIGFLSLGAICGQPWAKKTSP